MRPFDFIIIFLSFVYTLGLTHLLFAATRMIRHRRSLTFSWPHAVWMFGVALMLVANWVTLWDFHELKTMSLAVVIGGIAISIIQYFACALVSPDFEDGETYDMHAFERREGRTYLAALLVLLLVALVINYAAGAGLGVQNWADQNAIVLAMLPPVLLAWLFRGPTVQIVAGLALTGLILAFLALYYPVLR